MGRLPFCGHGRTILPLNSFPASVPIVCEEFPPVAVMPIFDRRRS